MLYSPGRTNYHKFCLNGVKLFAFSHLQIVVNAGSSNNFQTAQSKTTSITLFLRCMDILNACRPFH